MTPANDDTRTPTAPTDRAAAEAAAERLMATYRLQQSIDSAHAGRERIASNWIIVAGTALFGALVGGLMGAMRGHAVPAALLMALVGGLLAIVRQRAP